MAEVLDHSWFCDAAGAEIAGMASVIAEISDISADVPTCPGWTIENLAAHTGTVHRWATSIVVTEAEARPPFPEVESPWSSAGELAGWLAAGAAPLLAALRAAGPVTPVWTWGPGRTSGWWARRILHETTVHRADAQLSAGQDPAIDPVIAADGIDEFLFNLPSARRPYRHLAELPTGATVHLHATDADGAEWMIRFTDSGIAWERGHEKATTAVRGPVSSLLLFAYGRIPASDPRLAVFGDESLPALWQEKTAL